MTARQINLSWSVRISHQGLLDNYDSEQFAKDNGWKLCDTLQEILLRVIQKETMHIFMLEI